jgi:hypothetical protein
MASTKDTKPTQVGGHQPAPSVGSPRIDVAQQIDGRLYSTRRAALIHTNAKGESLYYDNGPGYFLVSVSRFIGNTPCYAVQPMSDEGLRQWATANGVLDRVTAKGAGLGTALIAKMVRDAGKRGGTAEEVLRKIVRDRPDEIASLLAKRLGA